MAGGKRMATSSMLSLRSLRIGFFDTMIDMPMLYINSVLFLLFPTLRRGSQRERWVGNHK